MNIYILLKIRLRKFKLSSTVGEKQQQLKTDSKYLIIIQYY